MRSQFTEHDTETFYDAEDALYRSFWDSEGSLHWGWFDKITGGDFLKACTNLNRVMAGKAGISSQSRVLDLGCGNGNTAFWLCKSTGCRVTGVDLSGVRISNAIAAAKELPPETSSLLEFEKASATELPFEEASFTHVWSQATIYHVHEKQQALEQVYLALEPAGLFVFDDLTKPKSDISPPPDPGRSLQLQALGQLQDLHLALVCEVAGHAPFDCGQGPPGQRASRLRQLPAPLSKLDGYADHSLPSSSSEVLSRSSLASSRAVACGEVAI